MVIEDGVPFFMRVTQFKGDFGFFSRTHLKIIKCNKKIITFKYLNTKSHTLCHQCKPFNPISAII
jgi:hypothetical protein